VANGRGIKAPPTLRQVLAIAPLPPQQSLSNLDIVKPGMAVNFWSRVTKKVLQKSMQKAFKADI
jgi:hypothetical protein